MQGMGGLLHTQRVLCKFDKESVITNYSSCSAHVK